jgi:amino acid transporter
LSVEVVEGLVLLATVALPFHALLRLSTTLTLLVFVLVSLSLWRLQQRAPRPDLAFHVPRWVPVAATLGNISLIAAQWALASLTR